MKIEPYYEDNEPLCTHDCPACFDDFPNWWKCRIKQSEVDEGEPCIPALRRDRDQALEQVKLEIRGRDMAIRHGQNLEEQRDQAIKERDDWKERTMKAEIKTWEKEDKIKALQREVCEYTKIIADDDGVIGVKVEDVAKSRGWPGLFEGGA